MSADEKWGDYPELCNCDDPESHDEAVTATDNARDKEPLAWCPGCGDRIPTEVIRERGVCSNCYGTSDDPWVTARAEAWDEGYQDGLRQGGEGEDGPRYVNPYAAAARAETTTGAIARGEALAAGDPDWMNVTRWPRAETTTATPPGLTVSEDGSVLNWQGVNYVPQRAEMTTATDEDSARVLDDVIQHLRKIWSTGHDEAREVIDTAEELLAQALPRLLATARTRPTRDKLDRVISDGLRKHGAFRTDLIADAVLALFRGGDK